MKREVNIKIGRLELFEGDKDIYVHQKLPMSLRRITDQCVLPTMSLGAETITTGIEYHRTAQSNEKKNTLYFTEKITLTLK